MTKKTNKAKEVGTLMRLASIVECRGPGNPLRNQRGAYDVNDWMPGKEARGNKWREMRTKKKEPQWYLIKSAPYDFFD